MNNCIFCKIARAEMGTIIWQNDHVFAINDIHPKAPTHILVIPKKHTESLSATDDPRLFGKLMMAIRTVTEQLGVQDAYRVHANNGEGAGQEVFHLHFHVLAGNSDQALDLGLVREHGL